MQNPQINEQIKWLEQELEARKRELATSGLEQKEEKEMVRDVVIENTQKELSSWPTSVTQATSDDEVKQKALELVEKEQEKVVEELLSIAFTKDVLSAIKVAEAMKNPHLLDAFHDVLADYYYQKLLEARKI